MAATSQSLLLRLGQPDLPGHGEAWTRFFHLYTPYLRSWAKRQGFQEPDADDITQTVLMTVVNKLATYDPTKGRFRSWLFAITCNECMNGRRRQKKWPAGEGDAGSKLEDERRPLEEFVEAEHTQWLLGRGEDLIRPHFNDATWAAYRGVVRDGRSVEVVAAELGLSPAQVYTARWRVLHRLRDVLHGLLD